VSRLRAGSQVLPALLSLRVSQEGGAAGEGGGEQTFSECLISITDCVSSNRNCMLSMSARASSWDDVFGQ